jgi:flagellar FliJ protein
VKRFRFRLENVLSMRKKQEEAVEREFARRKAELLAVENRIRDVRRTLRDFRRTSGYGEGLFTAADAIAVDRYIDRLEHTIKRLGLERDLKQVEVDRSMERLVEARKSRKVMEILRDRQWRRYVEEANREESLDLDDINQSLSLHREKLALTGAIMEEY